jgi:long-subunit fatty acid transport protein
VTARAPWAAALVAAVLASSLPTPARAGGFYLPGPGIVAQGRAGAYVATSDELIGAFYNPAGLHQIDGLYIHLAAGLVANHLSFERAGGQGIYKPFRDGEDPSNPDHIEAMLARPFDPVVNSGTSLIPEAGIAFGLEKPDLTFGFAWYAPYATPDVWAEDGPQRYTSIGSSSWQLHWSLFVSAKLAPWLAVGVSGGVMLLRSQQAVKATAHVLADQSVGLVHNDENPLYDIGIFIDAWQRGKPWINAGVMFMPAPWMRIGAGFSPGFRMRAEGDLSLAARIEVWEGAALRLDTADVVGLEADLPPILRFGVAVIPRDGLEFELDVHAELWSRLGPSALRDVGVDLTDLQDQIAALAPGFSDEIRTALEEGLGDEWAGPNGTGVVEIPSGLLDTVSVRFGAEGRVQPWLRIRGGCLFESGAHPDNRQSPSNADANKFGLSFGLSAGPPGLDVHLAWMHYFYAEATVLGGGAAQFTTLPGIEANNTNDGVYRSHVDVLGLAVTVRPQVIDEEVRRIRDPYRVR